MGRGLIARYEQFLLFPQCVLKDLYCRHVKTRVNLYEISSKNATKKPRSLRLAAGDSMTKLEFNSFFSKKKYYISRCPQKSEENDIDYEEDEDDDNNDDDGDDYDYGYSYNLFNAVTNETEFYMYRCKFTQNQYCKIRDRVPQNSFTTMLRCDFFMNQNSRLRT